MASGSRKYNVIGKFSHWEAEVMKDGADLFRGDFNRAGIFKPLWSPGIDAKASIPPAYVAWRAGTITLFLLGA
jgi:hypothetical protein